MKKRAFLFLCMLAAGALQAQETIFNKERFQERVQNYVQKGGDTTLGKMPNLVIVPGGNRVVALPQDGMPCLVPDVRGLAPMPNPGLAVKEPPAAQIPNAWRGKNNAPTGKK